MFLTFFYFFVGHFCLLDPEPLTWLNPDPIRICFRNTVKNQCTILHCDNCHTRSSLLIKGLFGLHLHSCTHWLRRATPPPPHLGSYTRSLLVRQVSRHDISLWVPLLHMIGRNYAGGGRGEGVHGAISNQSIKRNLLYLFFFYRIIYACQHVPMVRQRLIIHGWSAPE